MSTQPSDKRDRLKKLCNELRFNANHGPYVTKVSADLQHAAADAIEELQSAPSAVSPSWQNCTRCGAAILNEHPEAVASVASSGPVTVTEEMVSRFLLWPLPKDFAPDAGISFQRRYNVGTPYEREHEPTGTNLLNADQARAMLEHVLGTTKSHVSPREETDANTKHPGDAPARPHQHLAVDAGGGARCHSEPATAFDSLINESGKFFDWGNDASVALKNLLDAYERRIRTECTPEQLEQKPWECMEFIEARRVLEAKPQWVVSIPSARPETHK